MKYLLPCSCGKSVAIEVRQAGHRVQCHCGKVLDVPAMRLIRQLAVDPADGPPKSSRDQAWPLTWRLLFVAGLFLGVGGLGAAAYYQFWRAQLTTEETPWDDIQQIHREIDQMSLEQTWDLWLLVRTQEIGPYRPPGFIQHRLVSANWYRFVIGGLVTAVVGAFLTACALVVGPRAKRATPKKKSGKKSTRGRK